MTTRYVKRAVTLSPPSDITLTVVPLVGEDNRHGSTICRDDITVSETQKICKPNTFKKFFK